MPERDWFAFARVQPRAAARATQATAATLRLEPQRSAAKPAGLQVAHADRAQATRATVGPDQAIESGLVAHVAPWLPPDKAAAGTPESCKAPSLGH